MSGHRPADSSPGSGPGSGEGKDSKGGGPTVKFSEPPSKPSDSNKTQSQSNAHASASASSIPSTNSGTSASRLNPYALHRPDFDRTITESSLPPHERESNLLIPVTPGIGIQTYDSPDSGKGFSRENSTGSPSYFQVKPPIEAVASPDPLDDSMAANAPEGADAASMSGHDILRRMSKSSHGRRESINTIRAAYPSLPLSGNVISATFNMPHSMKYRKAADWVSAHLDTPRRALTHVCAKHHRGHR